MKLHYDPETDSLFVRVAERPSEESEEIASGVVVDFDADGNVVAFEVEGASQRFDLRELEAEVGAERIAMLRFVPAP